MTTLRTTALRVALAFGLSFALWAFVSFSQNPEELVPFSDLPLQVVGLGPDLVIVDSNGLPNQVLPTVDVTLRTDRRQLAQLRQVDVRAVVDLTDLTAGEHIVPVNVEATRSNISVNVASDGVEPSVVPIRLEQLSQKAVPIRVETGGNMPFSFERGEAVVTFGGNPVTTTLVVGPQSRVERVEAALARANIEQLRATYLAPLSLSPVDGGGQAIEGVRLDPGTVTVQIPINPVVGLKLVPVAPNIVGLPAPGFAVRGVTVTPPLIALTGSSGPLDTVDLLTTEPFDISGLDSDRAADLPIVFPVLTSPNEGEPNTVRVTVEIAPIQRPFQARLPAVVQLVGVAPGLNAVISPASVSVPVTGSSEALADLVATTLRAVVDVSGLGAGGYGLPVRVELPEGVALVGDPPIVQVSLRALPTPTDEADAGTEPDETPAAEVTPTSEALPTVTAAPDSQAPTPEPSPAPGSGETPTATPGG